MGLRTLMFASFVVFGEFLCMIYNIVMVLEQFIWWILTLCGAVCAIFLVNSDFSFLSNFLEQPIVTFHFPHFLGSRLDGP